MTYDPSRFVPAVRRLVDENPDFVYQRLGRLYDTCLYVVEDDRGNLVGSCLVGQALIEAGMLPETLVNEVNGLRIDSWMMRKLVRLDPDTVDWAYELQQSQDEGATWAEALERADKQRERTK